MHTANASRHLFSVEHLTDAQIDFLLRRAAHYKKLNTKHEKTALLKGHTVFNLFYENSTRTRSSFELAGKRMGADVINISASTSSTSKGESFIDTVQTLDAMDADFLVIRHPESGTSEIAIAHSNAHIINAGDGCHQHPSQALLDCFTLQEALKKLKGKIIVICGDILHSRVARSNMVLLSGMGMEIRLVSPATLALPTAMRLPRGVSATTNFKQALEGADAIMMLRVQKERMSSAYIASEAEYFHLYGLDYSKLALAKKSAFVLHPGPMNRGMEIDSHLADDPKHSLVKEQVNNGVAIRQAIFEALHTGYKA